MNFLSDLDYKIFYYYNDTHLLYLPRTSALFKIDTLFKEILEKGSKMPEEALRRKLYRRFGKARVEESMDELRSVDNGGLLCNIKKEGSFMRPERKNDFQRMEIHLSNDCNMACSYCFAKGGKYGLNLCCKKMNWHTARKTIEWFIKLNKDRKEALSIQFFGGEPLLNIGVLEKTLSLIRRKSDAGQFPFIQLQISTNGTLLTDNAIRILAKYNCIPWVSLDATKSSHNKRRVYKDGRGTYDDVLAGIKRLKRMAPELPVVLCPTFDKDDSVDVIDKLQQDLKIEQLNVKFEFSLYNCSNTRKRDFDSMLKKFWENMNRILSAHLEKGMPLEILSDYRFFHLHVGRDTYSGCGAGRNRIAVDAEGDIFICSVGMGEKTGIGNVQSGLNPGYKDLFDNAYGKLNDRTKDCVNCWARRLCNGPCLLSDDKASAVDGLNRICDYSRFQNEFYLKSYASIRQEDAKRIFGVNKRTEKVLKKIDLLYCLRDLRNKNLRHIEYVTPILSPIKPAFN